MRGRDFLTGFHERKTFSNNEPFQRVMLILIICEKEWEREQQKKPPVESTSVGFQLHFFQKSISLNSAYVLKY